MGEATSPSLNLLRELAKVAAAGEHGRAERSSGGGEEHEDDCHDDQQENEVGSENLRVIQVVQELGHHFLNAGIGVGRRRLLDGIGEGATELIGIAHKHENVADGEGEETGNAGNGAKAHAHARGNECSRDAALIEADGKRSRAQQPKAAADGNDRGGGEDPGNDSGEKCAFPGDVPSNVIRIVVGGAGAPGLREHVRNTRVGRRWRLVVGGGDANLWRAAVGAERQGLVDGSLTLVAEVVHEG